MNPFNRKAAEQISDVEFRRASGRMVCQQCGRIYYLHPLGGPLGFDGNMFLNQLCDGTLVKL